MLDDVGVPHPLFLWHHVDDQPIVGEAQVELADAERLAHPAARAVRADHIARVRAPRSLPIFRIGEAERDAVGYLIDFGQLPTPEHPHVGQRLDPADQHPLEIGLEKAVRLRPAGRARAVPVDLEQGIAQPVQEPVWPVGPDHRIDQRLKLGREPRILQETDRLMINRAGSRQRIEGRPPLVDGDGKSALTDQQRRQQPDRPGADDSYVAAQDQLLPLGSPRR